MTTSDSLHHGWPIYCHSIRSNRGVLTLFFIILSQQSKDGIFWMSWQDFQIHFRSIYVCRIYPPEMRYSVHGQWRGYSAGGCQDYETWHQNPQFRLRATGPDAALPIHVFITLTQVSLKLDPRYIYAQLSIFY